MPVHPTKGGGYQWGKSGKVYKGKGAKAKAQDQADAIFANGYTGENKGKKKGKTKKSTKK